MQREINNELLLTAGENLSVTVPTADCLLGDKLTAFAPHTTGILLGSGKELEIIKQLFDIANLTDYLKDYEMFAETYAAAAREEAAFRGGKWSREDVLRDTVRACTCIISRGTIDKDEYPEYLRGIKSLRNHILVDSFHADEATWMACKVLYLVSCMISGNPFRRIDNPEAYLSARLEGDEYKKLAYVRKQRPDAYACLVEATRNLH